MARVSLSGMAVRGIVGCIPEREVSNEKGLPLVRRLRDSEDHGHGGDQVTQDGG